MDMERVMEEYGPMLIDWASKIVGVLVLFIAAWIVASATRSSLRRALEKRNLDATLTRFLTNTVRWLILIVAATAALGVFGVETTSFAAVLGAMGLAIGLAFQGSLSNVAAGVMLLIFRPFKVGDFVSVAGVSGTIDAIDLLITTLDTPDNKRIILPNSSIFGSVIENVSYHPIRRVDLPVGVAYDSDLDATRKLLEEVAATIPDQVEDKPSQIVLSNLGDSSVDWVIRVWVQSGEYWPTMEKLRDTAKKRLDEEGIGIPFPNMELQAGETLTELFGGKNKVA